MIRFMEKDVLKGDIAMKKKMSLFMALTLLFGLYGCGTVEEAEKVESATEEPTVSVTPAVVASDNPVEISVVTCFGSGEGHRAYYESAYKTFETTTGHTVHDMSSSLGEEWNAKVLEEFRTGAEPDVLYFHTGTDANTLILQDKVVSLEEIRQVYPSYGNNMTEELLPVSSVDGKAYAVPVNGYWEGLYVNLDVFEELELYLPQGGYTWDSFLAHCELLQEKGFFPLAVAMDESLFYLLELAVQNQRENGQTVTVPHSGEDVWFSHWCNALEDVKNLYDLGYVPEEPQTLEDNGLYDYFMEGKTGFLFGGSGLLPLLEGYSDGPSLTVTYTPSKNGRENTEVVGGISMGYYITRRAWEDEARRDAAVQFVTAMTTDAVVNQFSSTNLTALQKAQSVVGLSELERKAVTMKSGVTAVLDSALEQMTTEERSALLLGVLSYFQGETTKEEVIRQSFGLTE